jgi:hypothetical protein
VGRLFDKIRQKTENITRKKDNKMSLNNISQSDIEKLFANIGVNTEKSSAVIDRYGSAIINLKDSQGNHILAKAIQMNDGYVVTALLERGADINGLIKENQSDTFYDYARKYATYNGRKPIALNAIETHFQAKAQCPVTLMDTAELMKRQQPDYTKEVIKIYHGARSSNSTEDLIFYLQQVVPTGIREKSPTLASFPVGQFFKPGSIGFSYDIPRELIAFDGEKNDKAVISLDTATGVARILNDEKLLAFRDFKSEVIYRPEISTKMTYNEYSQQEDEFDVKTCLLEENQVSLLTQMKNKLESDYQTNVKSKDQLKVTDKISAMREQFFESHNTNTNTNVQKEKPTI